jgi:demethylmenaquinone methyltransferase/2-methoxy-6-polyprenyl-1,4-benzoquinol methylase
VRLSVLGSSDNRAFARDELPFLRRYFADVRRELSPTGRSKLIFGTKQEGAETPG